MDLYLSQDSEITIFSHYKIPTDTTKINFFAHHGISQLQICFNCLFKRAGLKTRKPSYL